MILLEEVLAIHRILIQKYGGSDGIRDEGLLLAALERPFAGFGTTAFYPKPVEKAAAILESIIQNHPFVDGNKRTGYVLMRLILMHYGQDIRASQDEKYDFVIQVASGEIDFEGIKVWLGERIFKIPD